MEKAFSDINLQRIIDQHKKPVLKHEWQAFCFKVFKELHGRPNELPQFMSLFKRYYESDYKHLNRAYSYMKDYSGYVPKVKMFYWSFWQFKKYGRIVGK